MQEEFMSLPLARSRTISVCVSAFPGVQKVAQLDKAIDETILDKCPFCESDKLEITNTRTPCLTVQCLECCAEVTGKSFPKRWRSWKSCLESYSRALADVLYRWNTRGGVPAGPLSHFLRESEKIFSGLVGFRED